MCYPTLIFIPIWHSGYLLCLLHCVIRHPVYSHTTFLSHCMLDKTCFTVIYMDIGNFLLCRKALINQSINLISLLQSLNLWLQLLVLQSNILCTRKYSTLINFCTFDITTACYFHSVKIILMIFSQFENNSLWHITFIQWIKPGR